MVDHPAQLDSITANFADATSGPVPVYIKTDTGYGRAGVAPSSKSLRSLLQHAFALRSSIHVLGFYSHLGHSYGGSHPSTALDHLCTELDGARAAAQVAQAAGFPASTPFTLSVGATPTAVAVQNLLSTTEAAADPVLAKATARAKELIASLQTQGYAVELHAGVYPVLDMQQLATHARPTSTTAAVPTMTSADIAITILAEVLSVYTERANPEVLVGAGCVALGRETCKSYPGWAVVAPAPWDGREGKADAPKHQTYNPDGDKTGWIVGRVAQEHGILTWEGPDTHFRELKVGEKLLLWPNHACIACSNFGWVLVVDSSRSVGKETEVMEVWTRWRGW